MREDEHNEFKKTTGELNEAMVSISAMLNKHRKGRIYFGLKNDGTPHSFTITDSTLRDVSRKIYESIKPQLIPIIRTDYIDKVEVIIVDFEGEDLPYSAFGRYYIRIADEDRELSPAELRRIMINQEYEDNWGNRTSNQLIEDANDSTVKSFFDSAVSCGRMPKTEYDKNKVLSQIGVLNGNHLTNAGVYLFSKHKPISLKMAVFATEHKDTFLDINRVEGNIFEMIDEAFSYIVKNIRWRVEMSDESVQRKEIPEVPLDAIRESIINSFAHARYDLPVEHEIDIFSNRISICNPGSFANEFEPIDFYHRDIRSYLRNEVIAKTLYLCKDVEAFGSGIKKIYTLCEDNGITVSYLNEETSFTIEFSRVDRNNEPLDGRINGGIKDRITEGELKILSLLSEHPSMTNKELAKASGKSERTVSRLLSLLKGKALIKRIGSNKTGYWKVVQ